MKKRRREEEKKNLYTDGWTDHPENDTFRKKEKRRKE